MRKLTAGLMAMLALLAVQRPAKAQNPSYSPATLSFGDHTNWRPAPTNGTLDGVYRTAGDWVQTGPITCHECRLYFGGRVTINNVITVSSGQAMNLESAGLVRASVEREGGGGGHGGRGGNSEGPGSIAFGSAGIAHEFPLFGGAGNYGYLNGGNGGGGFYVEALGNVLITAAGQILANGLNGANSANDLAPGAGGGAGGGIDIRTLGAVTIQNGALLQTQGGNGGTANVGPATGANIGGGGGGGGVVNIEALGGLTNNGSVSVTPGLGGSGLTGSGAAGSAGIFNSNSYFSGPRLGGW